MGVCACDMPGVRSTIVAVQYRDWLYRTIHMAIPNNCAAHSGRVGSFRRLNGRLPLRSPAEVEVNSVSSI